jgi:hypothetical protein
VKLRVAGVGEARAPRGAATRAPLLGGERRHRAKANGAVDSGRRGPAGNYS